MKVVFINHHLFQDGDTYGLIYALVLNQALAVDALRIGLFWINDDLYQPDGVAASVEVRDYTRKVQTRLGYFESFGQFGTQLVLVRCRFRDDVDVVECRAGDNELIITANATLFNRNPRRVSLFVTGEENDPSLWLKQTETQLEARVKVDAGSLDYASRALGISLELAPSSTDQGRLRQYLSAHTSYPEASCRFVVRGLGPRTRTTFKATVIRTFELGEDAEVHFAYISKSTDYVRQCITVKGFAAVATALRGAVLHCTRDYAPDNARFIQTFMAGLVEHKDPVGKLGLPVKDAPAPIILLFWIRGAKKDEESAILGTFDHDDAVPAPSPGKPQHHTNVTLYKQVRHMVKALSTETKQPILFVPIGDELVEDFGSTVADASRTAALSRTALEHAALVLGISLTQRPNAEQFKSLSAYLKVHYSYTVDQVSTLLDLRSGFKKVGKDHNLIRFFEREPFRGRPMGAQINFLLQLATQYPVIQVGMRSGSMERLMYLGVPTIYFDRTKSIPELPNPVGASRIKQLCLFEGDSLEDLLDYFLRCDEGLSGAKPIKGYPLFFQIENRDTGFLKYSSLSEVRIGKMIEKLAEHHLREYNQLKQKVVQKGFLASSQFNAMRRGMLELGGLVDAEEQKMLFMLWFMMVTHPRYSALLGGAESRSSGAPPPANFYLKRFNNHRQMRDEAIAAKRSQRSQKKEGSTVGTASSTSSPGASSGMGVAVALVVPPRVVPVVVAAYQVGERVRVDYAMAYDIVGRVSAIEGNMVSVRIEHCYVPGTMTAYAGGDARVLRDTVMTWSSDQILRKEA